MTQNSASLSADAVLLKMLLILRPSIQLLTLQGREKLFILVVFSPSFSFRLFLVSLLSPLLLSLCRKEAPHSHIRNPARKYDGAL